MPRTPEQQAILDEYHTTAARMREETILEGPPVSGAQLRYQGRLQELSKEIEKFSSLGDTTLHYEQDTVPENGPGKQRYIERLKVRYVRYSHHWEHARKNGSSAEITEWSRELQGIRNLLRNLNETAPSPSEFARYSETCKPHDVTEEDILRLTADMFELSEKGCQIDDAQLLNVLVSLREKEAKINEENEK